MHTPQRCARLCLLAALGWLALGSTYAHAQQKVYRYVDEEGTIHFADYPRTDKFVLVKSFLADPTSRINRVIDELAEANNVDPHLVRAMVLIESSYKPSAISSKGAMGLMQLMPETAKALDVADPLDIEQNLSGGVRYIRKLLDRFRDTRLALAAYNAGPTNVDKHKGIPPFPETINYVKKVLHWRDKYRKGART